MVRKTSLVISPGNIVRYLSSEETEQILKGWLSIFGKNREGVNSEAFLWHIFSGGRYPSSDGEAALREYGAQPGTEFIVLSNDRELAFITDALPRSCSLSDFYVFPKNLAWTMAFTHEAGWLGPYFARHPDFADFARKAKEAELARQKGWH